MSGSESISTKDLAVLNNDTENINELKGITAEQMRASTAAGKEAGKDIVVTFGGLKWTPTYLSKTKPNEKNGDGDLILTLWLSDSAQLEGKTYDPTRDPFNANGRATWNAGGYANNTPTPSYPDAMYGTSYMNAVVLNNGGYYKPDYSVDEVTKVEKYPNHAFSLFTTDEKLTKYIATPSEVTWQEFGQDKRLFVDYTLSNENWSETINKNGKIEGDPTETSYNFNGNYNYAGKQYSNQWSTSTLWLPSMSETGYSDSEVGIWETSTAQRSNTNTYDSWLRSGHYAGASGAHKLTSAGSDVGTSLVSWSYAVRPSLHLNLTEAAKNAKQPTLADTTAEYAPDDPTNESFKDIYKITTETGVDFHIKTAAGFLKLSEATAAGQSFDPSWTFYLDNDITLNLGSTYTPVGSWDYPFAGTFNGQNNTINFNLTSDKESSIFYVIENSTFCNLNINYDVNLTGESSTFYSLCRSQNDNTTCNLSHINITGSITSGDVAWALGMFIRAEQSFQSFYDVNVNLTSVEAPQFAFVAFCICDINSCSFICQQTSAMMILAFACAGQANVSNIQFVLNATDCALCTLSLPQGLGSLTIIESSFDISLSGTAAVAGVGIGMVEEGELYCQKITLLDVVINCRSFTNILIDMDSMSGITDYPPGYYYSGVYIHDPVSNTTTILDPNFTSYKWRVDTRDESSLPILSKNLPTDSTRKYFESLDMRVWAKQKMAN